jgi:hypothetical protein
MTDVQDQHVRPFHWAAPEGWNILHCTHAPPTHLLSYTRAVVKVAVGVGCPAGAALQVGAGCPGISTARVCHPVTAALILGGQHTAP